MEVLVLDGKNYVKAAKAARDLGYASDYVGQLCRSGQVDSHLIGRTWYVNQDELGNHRLEKKRMSRIKAREHAKKAINEVHHLKISEGPTTRKNIDIRYEADERDLIPKTRKLGVQSVGLEEGRYPSTQPAYDSETVVENEGEKIVMSGDLEVVDVTEAPIDTDTVILTPKKIRKSKEAPVETSVSADQNAAPERRTSRDFIDRLTREKTEAPQEEEHAEVATPALEIPVVMRPGMLICVSLITLMLILIIVTLPVTKVMRYSSEEGRYLISYDYSAVDTLSNIQRNTKISRLHDILIFWE